MEEYPVITQPPPINALQSQLSALDISELMLTPTLPPPPYPAISSGENNYHHHHHHHQESFNPSQPSPPHNDSMTPSDGNFSNAGGWCELVCNPFLCCDSSLVPNMYSWCCCFDDESMSAAPADGIYDDSMGVGCCDGLEDCCAADGADCDMDCVIS